MSEVLKELYVQQLTNINNHYVTMQTYELFEDFEQMKRIHREQYCEEMKNHIDLLLTMIHDTRQVVYIPDIKKPTMLVTERPPSKLKRTSLSKTMLESWEQWEETILPLYDNAIKEYPDCKLLKALRKKAESEIKYIHKLLGCQ